VGCLAFLTLNNIHNLIVCILKCNSAIPIVSKIVSSGRELSFRPSWYNNVIGKNLGRGALVFKRPSGQFNRFRTIILNLNRLKLQSVIKALRVNKGRLNIDS